MAEIVHRNLESMLPELEELERSGIFTHQEIRVVVRRRRNHEYKMLRKPARKQDFLMAIQYELHLDMLRKHRKKKFSVVSLRYDAEFGMQNRISSLFRRSLKKFKGDLKLWLQYIDFAKQSGRMQSLSTIFGKALAIHPTNPGLWIMAAKFEFEEQKNTSAARILLQQGLRANPEAKKLWLEYFRMELMHTDKIRKRRSVLGLEKDEDEKVANMSDEFLSYQTASLVYKQAIKQIPNDVEFRLAFLPIYHLFEDTSARQQEVYNSLQSDFPSHPLTWEALARRPWMNLDPSSLSSQQIAELERETELVFSKGMAATVDADTALLWEKYIEWCSERLKNEKLTKAQQQKASKRLLTAFKKAAEDGKLSQVMFQRYLECVSEMEEGGGKALMASIVVQATSAHPQAVPLWLARLRACGGEGVDEVCRLALAAVPEELSLPIWQYCIENSIKTNTNTEDIFQSCLGQCGARGVCEVVAILYLDWAYLEGGIKKSRRIYKRLLHKLKAWSLYQKCISMELQNANSSTKDVTRLRELFEEAVREFGACSPELWLQYIEAEARRRGGGGVENVGRLHWRAVKCLQPELTERFITEYAAMQAAAQ